MASENTGAESDDRLSKETFDALWKMIDDLPWITPGEMFEKAERRGREKGRAERDLEIAMIAFERLRKGGKLQGIVNLLRVLDISEATIRAAKEKASRIEG
jgi:hypothetical protein